MPRNGLTAQPMSESSAVSLWVGADSGLQARDGHAERAMTIAACYLSPEGVVFGADSTSTYNFTNGRHHFNYGQKIFEISDSPETGTLALVTWGLGGLSVGSYRTLVA